MNRKGTLFCQFSLLKNPREELSDVVRVMCLTLENPWEWRGAVLSATSSIKRGRGIILEGAIPAEWKN